MTPAQAFHKNMTAISAAITPAFLKELQASNLKPVSERTLQFDVPKRADGTNRIKLTVEADGTFQVRGYRVEETDLITKVVSSSVTTALKNIGTV